MSRRSTEPGPVLHLIPRFRNGGAEHVIRDLATRCHPRGVVGTGGGEWIQSLGTAGIEMVKLPLHPSTPTNAVRSLFAVRRAVREMGISIIHSHHRFASTVGRVVAAVEHVPFVSTVHDLASGSPFLTRLGVGSKVTVFSDAVSNHLSEHFGVTRETIERLPMGLFDDEVARIDSSSAMKSGPPVIAFAGRLSREKGIDIFVDALPLIRSRVDISALIIGEGEERKRVLETLKARGLSEVVTLTGVVDDIAPLLARSDVVVVPSLREGFGRVVIEALGVGTIVVASAVGGICELVHDGDNGLLVPAGDAQALADAVVRVLTDPPLSARLREGARATPTGLYSIQRMADQMTRIYGGLLQ